ncbi:MAG: hypothetical protein J0M12_08325 [Deltaproteobacteria bacterium]|nr:hypothetical protein [Deltaproteobacteria bacterium]
MADTPTPGSGNAPHASDFVRSEETRPTASGGELFEKAQISGGEKTFSSAADAAAVLDDKHAEPLAKLLAIQALKAEGGELACAALLRAMQSDSRSNQRGPRPEHSGLQSTVPGIAARALLEAKPELLEQVAIDATGSPNVRAVAISALGQDCSPRSLRTLGTILTQQDLAPVLSSLVGALEVQLRAPPSGGELEVERQKVLSSMCSRVLRSEGLPTASLDSLFELTQAKIGPQQEKLLLDTSLLKTESPYARRMSVALLGKSSNPIVHNSFADLLQDSKTPREVAWALTQCSIETNAALRAASIDMSQRRFPGPNVDIALSLLLSSTLPERYVLLGAALTNPWQRRHVLAWLENNKLDPVDYAQLGTAGVSLAQPSLGTRLACAIHGFVSDVRNIASTDGHEALSTIRGELAVNILRNCAPPGRAAALERLLSHSTQRVSIEAASLLGPSHPEARKVLMSVISMDKDTIQKQRLHSVDLLSFQAMCTDPDPLVGRAILARLFDKPQSYEILDLAKLVTRRLSQTVDLSCAKVVAALLRNPNALQTAPKGAIDDSSQILREHFPKGELTPDKVMGLVSNFALVVARSKVVLGRFPEIRVALEYMSWEGAEGYGALARRTLRSVHGGRP